MPGPLHALLLCLLIGALFRVGSCARGSSWGHQDGRNGKEEEATSVEIGSDGTVYLGGWTWGDLFGSSGYIDYILVALNGSTGEEMWGYQHGSTATDQSFGTALSPQGALLAAGWTTGNLYAQNGAAIESTNDYFVASVDISTRTRMWGVQYGNDQEDAARDVATDDKGEVFVTGNTVSLYNPPGAGNSDMFIARLNKSTGEEIWGVQLGSVGVEFSHAIAVDSRLGIVYAVGETSGSLFGANPNNLASHDYFIYAITVDKEEVWRAQYGTSTYDAANAVAVDAANTRLYVAGYSNSNLYGSFQGSSDYFVAAFDSVTGEFLWGTQGGGTESDVLNGIALSASGLIYAAGDTTSSLFSENLGGKDYFMVILNVSGHHISDGIQNGTVQDDGALDVASGLDDEVIVAGGTTGLLFRDKNDAKDYFAEQLGCPPGYYLAGGFTCVQCPAGGHSLGDYMLACALCPSSTSSDAGSAAAEQCTDCPAGTFSESPGDECEDCPLFRTSAEGSENCPYYKIPLVENAIFYVVGAIGLLILATTVLIKTSRAHTLTVVVASADCLMDVVYLTTTTFFSKLFIILAGMFIFLPFLDFAFDIYETAEHKRLINDSKYIVTELKQLFPYPGQLLLSWRVAHISKGYPYIGRRKIFPSDEGVVNLAYFAIYLVCMMFVLLLMVPWVIFDLIWFAPWALIHVPYYTCVLLVGYFFYQCKLLQHAKVLKFFNSFMWNNKTNVSDPTVGTLDIGRMNRSTLAQLLLESCPQLIIQVLNEIYVSGNASTIYYVSAASTAAMISFSLYRILYWSVWRGVAFEDIPPLVKFNEKDSISLEFSPSFCSSTKYNANASNEAIELLKQMNVVLGNLKECAVKLDDLSKELPADTAEELSALLNEVDKRNWNDSCQVQCQQSIESLLRHQQQDPPSNSAANNEPSSC